MLQTILDRVSEHPQAWIWLRRAVEADFHGEKKVIEQELAPWRDVGQRRFLDFGCGTGAFAPSFPARHYTGVDLAAHYVHYAGQTQPGTFAVTNGAAIGLCDSTFDASLVLGVLHHLPNELAREVVAELHRVLKPGATLLVIEDVPPPAWNLGGHVMHWLDRGGFIRNDDDYRALFGDGFEIMRTYPIRSGVCDYGVYVLRRDDAPAQRR